MNNHSTGFLLVLSVLMFGCQNQPEQQMMNPDGPSTNETADCRTAYPGLVSTIAGHLADAGAPGAAIAIVTNGNVTAIGFDNKLRANAAITVAKLIGLRSWVYCT